MLVFAREPGKSVVIFTPGGEYRIRVLRRRANDVHLQLEERTVGSMEATAVRALSLPLGTGVELTSEIFVTVVDLRAEVVRIGIDAPKEAVVHRLEVYEALRRENGDRPDPGMNGSLVPRPPGSHPPSLSVRLQEPRPTDAA